MTLLQKAANGRNDAILPLENQCSSAFIRSFRSEVGKSSGFDSLASNHTEREKSVERVQSIVHSILAPRSLWRTLWSWLPALILVTGATAVFLDLAGDVWLREGFTWDRPIMLAIHSFSTPWLDLTMIAVTQLGTYGVGLALLGVSWWLWQQRDRRAIWALWFSLGGGVLINTALKVLFARPRPTVFPPLTVETSYSFPSGHTIAAVSFYGFLALLLWQNRQRLFAILTALLIPLIAFSRIYLGVHYPSDVVGAWTLGMVWLALVWFLYLYDWSVDANTTEPASSSAGVASPIKRKTT